MNSYPQGMKKCRYWICNEEGHYVNECPNRKNYLEKVKLITEAISNGFQPTKDPYERHLHVYTMKIIVQSSSDSDITTNPESSSDPE